MKAIAKSILKLRKDVQQMEDQHKLNTERISKKERLPALPH